MAMFEKSRNARRGVAIILATFAIVILGVLAAGFMVSSITEHQMSFNETEATASVQCADGGISSGFQALMEMTPPPCGTSGSYQMPTYTYADGSTLQTQLVYADTNDCSDEHQGWGYTIHSECTRPGGTRAVIEMQAIVNKETPACMIIPGCCTINAWYWDWDIVQGRMHCNPRIQLYNSSEFPPRGARFYGKVTSSASSFRCSGRDDGGGCPEGYATFYDGYELNVPEVDCTVSYVDARDCLDNNGIELPKFETWIELYADGTFTAWQPDNNRPGYPNTYLRNGEPFQLGTGWSHEIPDGSVLACPHQGRPGDLHLRGTLNGELTIMSGRKIYVEGDILLADDPRMGPCDHRLGLLAGGAGHSAADGDLVIRDLVDPGVDGDRLIFANYVGPHCNAGVDVADYNHRAREGILTIYGTVMEGQLRPTENSDGTTGYGTDWILDPRTCPAPPPCFPDLAREDGTVRWVATKVPKSWGEVY